MTVILKAKFNVENASITDNIVESIHAEAFATDDLHGLDPVELFDFFEQNKVICSAVARTFDASKC